MQSERKMGQIVARSAYVGADLSVRTVGKVGNERFAKCGSEKEGEKWEGVWVEEKGSFPPSSSLPAIAELCGRNRPLPTPLACPAVAAHRRAQSPHQKLPMRLVLLPHQAQVPPVVLGVHAAAHHPLHRPRRLLRQQQMLVPPPPPHHPHLLQRTFAQLNCSSLLLLFFPFLGILKRVRSGGCVAFVCVTFVC